MRIFAALMCCLLLGCRGTPSGKMPDARTPTEDRASQAEDEGTANAEPTRATVDYPAGKETLHGLLCRPASSKAPVPGLVLIHDANGCNGWARDQAYHLASRGFVVLAVDLYRGEAPADLMDAHILSRGLPEDRVLGDLKAAVDYLATRPEVNPDALGAIGFGMGGGYALEAALHDRRLRAVVNCYGQLLTDPKLLAPLNATLFCIFAGKDEGISADTISRFTQAMRKAGKTMHNPLFCPDCAYGFLDPANWPSYGKPKEGRVKDAWYQIGIFLNQELRAASSPKGRQPKRREEDG